eukprot:TRINITY_DN19428_c0_g1_i1.p1 TRINITY_DN19428_c0_g1~~TRINITY_DN19428_c0_g1_i1.p1  ORF type:complete len:192 (+),score=59.35 TRINITY_DN19428_c0_g1_i1:71-577(+)
MVEFNDLYTQEDIENNAWAAVQKLPEKGGVDLNQQYKLLVPETLKQTFLYQMLQDLCDKEKNISCVETEYNCIVSMVHGITTTNIYLISRPKFLTTEQEEKIKDFNYGVVSINSNTNTISLLALGVPKINLLPLEQNKEEKKEEEKRNEKGRKKGRRKKKEGKKEKNK